MENKGWRRLFIVRKDLNMSPGKMAAQLAHCAEVYWLKKIQEELYMGEENAYADLILDKKMVEGYIQGHIVKTVCEARNLNHLLKAADLAKQNGLKENEDFGFINDACFTELQPENENGTTTTAMWFAPLPDEIAHNISKHYNLYKE